MNSKKILAFILSFVFLLNLSFCEKIKAVDLTIIGATVTIGGVAVNAVKYIYDGVGKLIQVVSDRKQMKIYEEETAKYKGCRPMAETARMIQDIVSGTSPIKIYGQHAAKQQCLNALSGCIVNINDEIAGRKISTEKRGNVIYMIGNSGVGKTTMAKAIANAVLKNDSHTFFFIDSSQVNREQALGEQLFKVINKVANLRGAKYLTGDKKDQELGTFDAKVGSPLLEHLFRWNDGAVVVIDEFEKMKANCRSVHAYEDFEDKSADEIIKSISANGYYMVGTEKVDCSKILFIITTNETREQLNENFGQGGSHGGGVQRLNIIEFENLDRDCCRRIINDMVDSIRKSLTDKNGDFRIKHIEFSEETLSLMATYVFNDQVKQARAKIDLEQQIYSLFFRDLANGINNSNKSFTIEYTPLGQTGEMGSFEKSEIRSIAMNIREVNSRNGNYDAHNRNPLLLVESSEDSLLLVDYA